MRHVLQFQKERRSGKYGAGLNDACTQVVGCSLPFLMRTAIPREHVCRAAHVLAPRLAVLSAPSSVGHQDMRIRGGCSTADGAEAPAARSSAPIHAAAATAAASSSRTTSMCT